jgi:urease accessory protein
MRVQKLLPISLLAIVATTPASAHHLMGGRTPATFLEGFLSGLGHPIIGPEHLAFLIAVGIIVGTAGLNLALPVPYIAAMAIGVALHVSGMSIPAPEVLVALSVLLAGALIVLMRPLPVLAWALVFALAGLLHGFAFGESIYGAERTPLAAYLLGLILIQSALTMGIALLARRLHARSTRIAGGVIAVLGIAALAGLV